MTGMFEKHTIRIYGQHITMSKGTWLEVLDDMKPECDNAKRIRVAIGIEAGASSDALVKALLPWRANDDKFVIHPYYTGRDKGCLMIPNPNYPGPGEPSHTGVLLFDTPEEAWEYIFTVVQPNDERAKHNYRVVTLKEYRGD